MGHRRSLRSAWRAGFLRARIHKQKAEIATLKPIAAPSFPHAKWGADDCVVGSREASGDKPRVVYRRAGDAYMLVEYGPIILDFTLRFRAHALMTALEQRKLSGILDLTPGIRSLQVHYDSTVLPLEDLLAELSRIEYTLGDLSDIEVPSRIVHLPLSWNDPAVQKTIGKYIQGVRPDAPWCPSNIEFIRRINGLDSIEDVMRIVFDATYVVLGLGDVYLGAPVATPVDPRHRLVTTKYNPARTWTPDNVVGIGGAYMCIYGMEGPGGYQLFGRTCQVWNTYRTTEAFEAGSPWLLRFFDQIRFYPVTSEELAAFRDGFLEGQANVKVGATTFRLRDYLAFVTENAGSISAFKSRQQAAFEAERARWQQVDQEGAAGAPDSGDEDVTAVLPPGATAVESPVPGSVWKILVEPGTPVTEGETLIILESMKMEMAVPAPQSGIVHEVRCVEGRAVALGQALVILREPHAEATA
jgi:urea carboxylase